MSPRSLAWLLLGWISCLALPVPAVELVEGPAVQVTDTTATIRWKTDVTCGTRVRFGASGDKLDGRAGEGVAATHEVLITDLKPDTAYAFSVGTAKASLKTDVFITAKQGASAKERDLLTKIKEVLTGKPPTTNAGGASSTPPTAKRAPPPTAKTWGNMRSLQDHFERHGADFQASSPDDYARQAWEFLQRAIDEGYPAKVDDADGTIRVWHAKSGAFAAYNRDHTTKTFFKPGSPDYFSRQPGRPVKLKRS